MGDKYASEGYKFQRNKSSDAYALGNGRELL